MRNYINRILNQGGINNFFYHIQTENRGKTYILNIYSKGFLNPYDAVKILEPYYTIQIIKKVYTNIENEFMTELVIRIRK